MRDRSWCLNLRVVLEKPDLVGDEHLAAMGGMGSDGPALPGPQPDTLHPDAFLAGDATPDRVELDLWPFSDGDLLVGNTLACSLRFLSCQITVRRDGPD